MRCKNFEKNNGTHLPGTHVPPPNRDGGRKKGGCRSLSTGGRYCRGTPPHMRRYMTASGTVFNA